MRKTIKLNFLLRKSNKFNYGQVLIKKKVVLTARSNLFSLTNPYLSNIKDFKQLLGLYDNNKISYTTLNFLLKKFNKKFNFKSDYSFLKVLTEFSWESGILLKKNKEINSVTFTDN